MRLLSIRRPITIAFAYTIDGLSGDRVILGLTAPRTKPETARVKVDPNGSLNVERNRYYQGQWKQTK